MASAPRPPNPRQSRNAPSEEPPASAQNSLFADAERSRRRELRTEAERTGRENSIRASRSRTKAAEAVRSSATPLGEPDTGAEKDPRAVPAYFDERYTRVGSNYHLPSGELAIIDRGRVLKTPLENTEVIRDLLALHRARGENALVVAGSERFRREAWRQASLAGMQVRGYRPSELELAQLARVATRERALSNEELAQPEQITPDTIERASRMARAETLAEERGSKNMGARVYSGRLIEHGEAHYEFDRREPLSYYVKIDTPQGEITQWGKDLGRAVEQSLSRAQSGDAVVVRHLGEKPVTVTRPVRNAQGEIVRKEEVRARLNRWSVERADFIEDRARSAAIVRDPGIDAAAAVSQRPELAGTYAELHVAKKMAPQLYPHPQDQARFVTRLREALADEIQRGEALSAPRVRDRRQEPDPKSLRIRERAQERQLS
jgi:hypothetical protein